MAIGLEDHWASKKVHYGDQKADLHRKAPFGKPAVQQHGCRSQAADRGCHKVIAHFYKGKQVGDQNNRAVKPIIGKVVDILSAADIWGKFWERVPCLVKLLAEVVWEDAVLADPVHLGAEDAIPAHKKPAEKSGEKPDCYVNGIWFPV